MPEIIKAYQDTIRRYGATRYYEGSTVIPTKPDIKVRIEEKGGKVKGKSSYQEFKSKRQKFTLRELVRVLKTTKIPQTTGSMIEDTRVWLDPHADYEAGYLDFVGEGCAIGVAAVELGINPDDLAHVLDMHIKCDIGTGLSKHDLETGAGGSIIYLNDDRRLSFKEIAKKIEKECKDWLDKPLTAKAMYFRVGKVMSEAKRT